MRNVRLALLVLVGLFILYTKYTTSTGPNAAPSLATSLTPPTAPASVDGVPVKAKQVLEIVRSTGQPPDGYVGGRVFENREGHLPADGDYREFDVDPHNGGRNAERLIVEWKTKKAWYTGDHYQTFTPLP